MGKRKAINTLIFVLSVQVRFCHPINNENDFWFVRLFWNCDYNIMDQYRLGGRQKYFFLFSFSHMTDGTHGNLKVVPSFSL